MSKNLTIALSGIPYGPGSSDLYWDDANNRLGIGTTSPVGALHVATSTDSNLFVVSGTQISVGADIQGGNRKFYIKQTDTNATENMGHVAFESQQWFEPTSTSNAHPSGVYGLLHFNSAQTFTGMGGAVKGNAYTDSQGSGNNVNVTYLPGVYGRASHGAEGTVTNAISFLADAADGDTTTGGGGTITNSMALYCVHQVEATNNYGVYFENTPNAGSIGAANNIDISIKTIGTGDILLEPSGNVGIGIDSPDAPLDVHGNVHLHSDSNDLRLAFGTNNHNEYMMFHFDGSGSVQDLQLMRYTDDWYTQMYFDRSTGNVGIGTSTPTETLTVSGSISAQGTIYSAGSEVGGGAEFSETIFTGAGSSTWNRIAGTKWIEVIVVGGGGCSGGSECNVGGSRGSGGGGGGSIIGYMNVENIASVTVTIGAGGTFPGCSQVGGTGGTSSFGAYFVANGGTGGTSADSGTQVGGSSGSVSVSASSTLIGAQLNANPGIAGSSGAGGQSGVPGYGTGGTCSSDDGDPGDAGAVIVRVQR